MIWRRRATPMMTSTALLSSPVLHKHMQERVLQHPHKYIYGQHGVKRQSLLLPLAGAVRLGGGG